MKDIDHLSLLKKIKDFEDAVSNGDDPDYSTLREAFDFIQFLHEITIVSDEGQTTVFCRPGSDQLKLYGVFSGFGYHYWWDQFDREYVYLTAPVAPYKDEVQL